MKNGRIEFPVNLLVDIPYFVEGYHAVIDTVSNNLTLVIKETDEVSDATYSLKFKEPILQKYSKLSDLRITPEYLTEVVRAKNFEELDYNTSNSLIVSEFGDFVLFTTTDKKYTFTFDEDPLSTMVAQSALLTKTDLDQPDMDSEDVIFGAKMRILESLSGVEKVFKDATPKVRLYAARFALVTLLDSNESATRAIESTFKDIDKKLSKDFNFLDHLS